MTTLRPFYRPVAALLAAAMATFSLAQSHAIDDPANLKGEQVAARAASDIPQNQGAPALWQDLLKLHTRASLMMIVAHPDDEDGGMLTYEVRGHGVRAAMLTLTRGEGGQNLMSADFNDALGLVRTEEFLSADQYLGVDQMFGTEVDFGFSKSREEALAQWTHQRVLYDAVRAVRLYRPLVVTSVFVGGPTDGHGHHQVAGEMAQEVFNAAGDPKVFPEMGLPPWSPLKVYSRVPFAGVSGRQIFDYATGKYVPLRFFNYINQTWSDTVPEANVTVHEGEVSPMLGMSYVQFARKGLALQKTQIGNGVRLAPAGAFEVRYHRWASRVQASDQEQSFFDGVDISLAGIAALAPEEKTFLPAGMAKLQKLAEQAIAGYSQATPATIAPTLKEVLLTVRLLIAQSEQAREISTDEKYNVLHELRIKEVQANDALAEAIGLSFDARLVSTDAVTPGAKLQVHTTVAESGVAATREMQISMESAKWMCGDECGSAALTHEMELRLPPESQVTRPYFTRSNIEQPYYDISDARLRNAPRTPYPLTAWVTAKYESVPIRAGEIVQLGGAGATASNPVTVVPAVSLAVSPSDGIQLPGTKSIKLDIEIRSTPANSGEVKLAMPAEWTATSPNKPFHLDANGAQTLNFDLTTKLRADSAASMTASAIVADKKYREGYRIGGYDARTRVAVYKPATFHTWSVDVKVAPGLNVAYLEGTGDDVPEYLKEMGVTPSMLQVSDITPLRLVAFDAVVLGVRAHTAHPDLALADPALLDYVSNGGTLIVQYDVGRMPEGFAPYPLALGADAEKVVEEDSKMELASVSSAIMRWPNAIAQQDFAHWVEERGHGFARTWDVHYEAPTETHDAGQDLQRGGLLVTSYGKGHYVYCAFALYRQMPEGVPGAYRLFANMLSLGKTPTPLSQP